MQYIEKRSYAYPECIYVFWFYLRICLPVVQVVHSPFQQHHQTNWWKRNGLKAFHCLHSNQSVGINCFHSIFCSVVNSRWTWKQQHFLLTANLLNVSLQNCMTFDSYQELHLTKCGIHTVFVNGFEVDKMYSVVFVIYNINLYWCSQVYLSGEAWAYKEFH